MKSIALTLSILVLTFLANAQSKVTIRGTIRDASTDAPLAYATVSLQETGTGTISNQEGAFVFSFADNFKGTISFSYLGYETLTLPIAEIDPEKLLSILLK